MLGELDTLFLGLSSGDAARLPGREEVGEDETALVEA